MKMTIEHLSTFYHTAILLMARRGLSGLLGANVERKLFGTEPAIVRGIGDQVNKQVKEAIERARDINQRPLSG